MQIFTSFKKSLLNSKQKMVLFLIWDFHKKMSLNFLLMEQIPFHMNIWKLHAKLQNSVWRREDYQKKIFFFFLNSNENSWPNNNLWDMIIHHKIKVLKYYKTITTNLRAMVCHSFIQKENIVVISLYHSAIY